MSRRKCKLSLPVMPLKHPVPGPLFNACIVLPSPDTKYIYVNVGFGFHAQLTLDEALVFIAKKEAHLQKYGHCDVWNMNVCVYV